MGWVRVVVWFGRIGRVRVRVWVRVWMRNKGIGAANVVSRDCALASDLVRASSYIVDSLSAPKFGVQFFL